MTRLALIALAFAAAPIGAPAHAQPATTLSPPAVCHVAIAQRFDRKNLTWRVNNGPEGGYFCQDTRHEFGGEGETFMFTYEVFGDAATVKKIWITSDFFCRTLPRDIIAHNVVPLLQAVYGAGGKGAPPDALVNAIAAVTPVHIDTPFGDVRTVLTPGEGAAMPNNGARYDLEIDLH